VCGHRTDAYSSAVGGHDKITSEVCLLFITPMPQPASSKKLYRAKHVLSNAEGTPSTQRKTFTYFSKPWRLCVFARDTFSDFFFIPKYQVSLASLFLRSDTVPPCSQQPSGSYESDGAKNGSRITAKGVAFADDHPEK
jgi:hypothetical protein